MDACKNNYNLLALAAGSGTGTGAGGVMIYDQRVGKAVRKHNFVHSGNDTLTFLSIIFGH